MSGFRTPDVLERRNNADAVKKAMLEKFRAVTQDTTRAEQIRAQRQAIASRRGPRRRARSRPQSP